MVARLGDAFANALTQSVGEGVYAIDLDGRLVFMNPAASAIVGWTEADLLGREVHEVLHRLDKTGAVRPLDECQLFAVARTGEPVTVDDDVFLHRDGHLVPIACSSSPMVADGEVIGAVVAFHEISAQKANEARLLSEARINETLLAIATTLHAQRDADAVVQLITEAATVVSEAAAGAYYDRNGEAFELVATAGDGALDRAELPETLLLDPGTVRVDGWLAVPVRRDTAELGRLVLSAPNGDGFGPEQSRLAEAVAAHAAIAIDTARRRDEAQRVSETLQRSMLPRALPAIEGIEAAARYLPAQVGVEVGGDWYDVVPLADDRVAIVIGDVAGHNVHAASVMAEVRNAVRAYAVEGHAPSGVVERANAFLCALTPDEMATCCYIELQPGERTATVVLAGHPPPVIGSGGEAAFVEADAGVPLGIDASSRYVETTVMLPDDGLLVLYTDGLVDHVHLPLTDGLAALRKTVAAVDGDLETAADSILVETAGVSSHDDAALLVVKVAGSRPHGHDVGRRLPGTASSAGVGRQFVTDVLEEWGVGGDTIAVVRLLISELVTNAVLHTTGGIELRLRLDDDRVLRGAVADESGERFAVVRDAGPGEPTGRGLLLVDQLSDRWGVDPHGLGKVVWFELEV